MGPSIKNWPWSSYPYYIGRQKRPAWLSTEFILGCFGQEESSAQRRYRRFVEKTPETEPKDPLKEVIASTFLDSADFAQQWGSGFGISLRENIVFPLPDPVFIILDELVVTNEEVEARKKEI